LRINLVVLGLTAMDSFHKEGVAENEVDSFFVTEIEKPVPGEHAFHAYHQPFPKGGYRFEKALW